MIEIFKELRDAHMSSKTDPDLSDLVFMVLGHRAGALSLCARVHRTYLAEMHLFSSFELRVASAFSVCSTLFFATGMILFRA